MEWLVAVCFYAVDQIVKVLVAEEQSMYFMVLN